MQTRPRIRISYHVGRNADARPAGWLGKLLAVAVTGLVVGAALVFSFLLFAILATLGLVAGGYMWWKTRALRKHLREQFAAMQARTATAPDQGDIIEGEYSRAPHATDDRLPPRH